MFLSTLAPIVFLLTASLNLCSARPTSSQPGAGSHLPSAGLHKRITISSSASAGLSDSGVDLTVTTNTSSSSYRSSLLALNVKASSTTMMGQYWPNWQTTQTASQISWDHADLAWYFVLPTSNSGYTMDGASPEGMNEFVAAAHAQGKTALVTIGGWDGSVYFSSLVSTDSSRSAFAGKIEGLLAEYGFDGVDLDWEYPGTQGAGGNQVNSADTANYLLFLHALRSTIGQDRIITAAMPADGLTGPDGNHLTDTSAFAEVLDFITVMAYDNYGSGYSDTTGPNAPLYTCTSQGPSDQVQINAWIKSGFPANQILLGIPSYSHLLKTASSTLSKTTYNGQSSLSFQSLASSQPTDPEYTYAQLIAQGYLSSDGLTGQNGFQRIWDDCTKTHFLWDAESRIWISFESPESAALKADYARSMGLAGVGFYDSTGFQTAGLERIALGLKGQLSADDTDDEVPMGAASASGEGTSAGSTVYLDPQGGASTSTTTIARTTTTKASASSSSSTTVWWTPSPSSSSATPSSSSSTQSEWSYVAPTTSQVWWTPSSQVWWTPSSVTSSAPSATTTPPSGFWQPPAANALNVLSASSSQSSSSRATRSSSSKQSTATTTARSAAVTSKSEAEVHATTSKAGNYALSLVQAPQSTQVQANDLAAALVFGSTSTPQQTATSTAEPTTRTNKPKAASSSTASAQAKGQAQVLVTSDSANEGADASIGVELLLKRSWSSRPQHRALRRLS